MDGCKWLQMVVQRKWETISPVVVNIMVILSSISDFIKVWFLKQHYEDTHVRSGLPQSVRLSAQGQTQTLLDVVLHAAPPSFTVKPKTQPKIPAVPGSLSLNTLLSAPVSRGGQQVNTELPCPLSHGCRGQSGVKPCQVKLLQHFHCSARFRWAVFVFKFVFLRDQRSRTIKCNNWLHSTSKAASQRDGIYNNHQRIIFHS